MVREGLKIENVCVCVCCTVFVNVCPPLQVARLQESLTEAKSESAVLREKVAAMTTTLEQQRQSDVHQKYLSMSVLYYMYICTAKLV